MKKSKKKAKPHPTLPHPTASFYFIYSILDLQILFILYLNCCTTQFFDLVIFFLFDFALLQCNRQVESSQSMIRIVGLSATLPNYIDVATFLKVNTASGLFYFDNSYRPVPLSQQYIGIKETNPIKAKSVMNEVCYNQVLDSVRKGHQVMVFVHSRKDTVKTAEELIYFARENDTLASFDLKHIENWIWVQKEVQRSKNKQIKELFESGFGIHHAGLLVSDRRMMERLFSQGIPFSFSFFIFHFHFHFPFHFQFPFHFL